MKSARKILAAVLLLVLAPVAVRAQGAPVQTADPNLRGLKQSDFPRLKQLEPNVYAYEELRPSDPGKFKTTVDMIVVTSATRWRRAALERRYHADGGPAATGSSSR